MAWRGIHREPQCGLGKSSRKEVSFFCWSYSAPRMVPTLRWLLFEDSTRSFQICLSSIESSTFKINFRRLCVYVSMYEFMCTLCMCRSHRDQKNMWVPCELSVGPWVEQHSDCSVLHSSRFLAFICAPSGLQATDHINYLSWSEDLLFQFTLGTSLTVRLFMNGHGS